MAEKGRKECGDDFLGKGLYEGFDRLIYHYCSIEAFMSIIRSKCMHLGDATTMNDYTENRLLGLLFRRIGTKLAERGMSAEDISLINQNFSLNNAVRYIACFSKERDGLFQWVKYGDDGKGVAIGFKFNKAQFSDHLPSCITGPDLHFSIFEMLYIGGEAEFSFEETAEWIADKIMEIRSSDRVFEGAMLISALDKICKHQGFAEEHEVRIASQPMLVFSDENVGPHVVRSQSPQFDYLKYKSRGSYIQSYIEFSFEPENVAEVIIGPKNTTDKLILKAFLEANGIAAAGVYSSLIPYL